MADIDVKFLEAKNDHMRQIAELKANLKRATFALDHFDGNPWKAEVITELMCAGIYQRIHETDPEKAVKDAINWNVDVALDPAVSSDAKKLVDKTVVSCVNIIKGCLLTPDNDEMYKSFCDVYNVALRDVEKCIIDHFAEPKKDVDDLDFV